MTKSRRNRIIALLVVLVIVIGATIGISMYETKQEEISASDEIIITLDSSAVTSLSWEYTDDVYTSDDEDEDETDEDSEEEEEEEEEVGTLSFHKEDDVWLYDEDEAFPVDSDVIETLLLFFEEFGVSFVIENVDDYSQYGLDDPVCTINIETEDTTYEITLGAYSTLDEERYISIGDGNVYLTSSDPYDTYALTMSDIIENDSVLTYYSIYGIEFSGEYEYSVYYEEYEEDSEYTYCSDDVFLAEVDGSIVPVDYSNLYTYVTALTGLDLTDYVTYNATSEELAACGLDDPELTITVDYTILNDDSEEEEYTYTLLVSRDPEEAAAAAEAAEEETEEETEEADEEDEEDEEEEEETITAYVMLEGSSIIYQITGDEYTALMAASYNDLRHSEVMSADETDMTAIYITLDGKTYAFTAEVEEAEDEDEEDVQTWYYDGEEIDISDITAELNGVLAQEYTDDEADGTLEISLIFYLDNENFSQVKVELYRHDSSTCLAIIDDTSFAYVTRSSVVDLIEAVNDIILG